MIWAMVLLIASGPNVIGTAIPYGSLEACQRDLPGAFQQIKADAEVYCTFMPIRLVGRVARIPRPKDFPRREYNPLPPVIAIIPGEPSK